MGAVAIIRFYQYCQPLVVWKVDLRQSEALAGWVGIS
jgi:hypothetical protein